MRSIYRSKEHLKLITILTSKDTSLEVKVFDTIKSLQCYAAMLGFEQGRRKSFDRKEVDNIEWHTFDNGQYTDYIYLIGLAETKNLGVLRYNVEDSEAGGFSEDMVKIFEEYANGGFHILQRWLDEKPGDPHGAKALIEGLNRSGFFNVPEEDKQFEEVEF